MMEERAHRSNSVSAVAQSTPAAMANTTANNHVHEAAMATLANQMAEKEKAWEEERARLVKENEALRIETARENEVVHVASTESIARETNAKVRFKMRSKF